MSTDGESGNSSDGEYRCDECGRTFPTNRGRGVHAGKVHDNEATERYPWRDPEWLRRLYWGEGLTQQEMADRADTVPVQIRRWMRKFDIETRATHWNSSKYPELQDEEYLRRVWVEDRWTAEEIAADVGCAVGTVPNVLRKYGIERDGPLSDVRELNSPVVLHHLYVERELTIRTIASIIGSSKTTVLEYLDLYEIPRRESGFREGGDHHNWKGGHSKQGADYGPTWCNHREAALERDDYRCQRCGIVQEDHIAKFGRELCVHHIVAFDPRQPKEPQHRLTNLITFCVACHPVMEGVPIDNRHNT